MTKQARHPWVALSTCAGKEPLSRAVAQAIVRRKDGKTRNAYRCPICRRWHVGSPPGRIRTLKPAKET